MRIGKYLVLRRASQLGILVLFLLGPLAGIWVVKGTLTFSYTLDTLPLADPYVLAQSLLALHVPEQKMLLGAAIVVAFYLLVGGRVYCSWVCPMNMVTDAAAWLRERLGLRMGSAMPRSLRYWILAMTLVLALATGTLAWELVNPVSMLHRGLVFGMGAAWAIVAAVFLLDLFVSPRAWCGHACPVGAFYSLIGRFSLLRVAAVRRAQCNDCMDCYAVCPEPQVITPALKGEAKGAGPVILSPACTNCARCIDVCTREVFEFGTRFGNTPGTPIQLAEAKELR
ncbi:MAG TPA: quinol dehydrogenase ferredoxin subunit NapH [Burkholderiales bacterium]|jgi:ferredoxin-type protein NapH|nr:quinol dehydrogenase ferredoxin subunit NapH [Burkholderiales bacterium]